MFQALEVMPDEVLVYNLMSAKFAFKQPSGCKDLLLDVVNTWKAEAERRHLHIGPRRVVPVFDRFEDKAKSGTEFVGVAFECPGCGQMHSITTTRKNESGARWKWDGNYELPTITPSICATFGGKNRCHVSITEGRAEFLSDCTHALAGATVDLPEA